MHRGLDEYGAGSGASHLVSGHTRAHHELEEALADFVGRPRALLFSTGWMANTGVITALLSAGDAVLEDRLNHASLIDGGLASGARFRRYRHADAAHCATLLERTRGDTLHRQLVVTDGVFSMDGDVAPLSDLAAAARRQRAWLMVDDAHGVGVLGRQGRGCADAAGLGGDDVQVLVGTLGKAFGTFGAFVAGSDDLIETLVQQARSYIYTTAMPAAVAVASLSASLDVPAPATRGAASGCSAHVARFRAGAVAARLCADAVGHAHPAPAGGRAARTALALSAALARRPGCWSRRSARRRCRTARRACASPSAPRTRNAHDRPVARGAGNVLAPRFAAVSRG
jgi:8-amino-7-oxononanoate synthase